jgi:ribose-phosphate pyrophosphokinase
MPIATRETKLFSIVVQGETSVKIMTSVREKDVFIVQSGSPKINDSIMELLIMISACKGGSATKITGELSRNLSRHFHTFVMLTMRLNLPAVLPCFPYSRQCKKKSHRGALTARMIANLLGVAGVKHVITVDLHASQMQGFFRCPVDNLHAEPLIAKWIRRNVRDWKEAVVVSKNAGGTKRVTSLADALKLNFGIVTTDKKRGSNMSASMIMNHLDGFERHPMLDGSNGRHTRNISDDYYGSGSQITPRSSQVVTGAHDSPRRANGPAVRTSNLNRSPRDRPDVTPSHSSPIDDTDNEGFEDSRAPDVTQARVIQGHIVDDNFPSPSTSAADHSVHDEDPMMMSHASSFFAPEPLALGGGGTADGTVSSDEEDDALDNPKLEHMITLVGDVRNRPVFIVDDMIDKPGSWIAAAETVVKRGHGKRVYCIATHGIFGGDCLAQLQACECIDLILVTNSFPISEEQARNTPKLVVIDLSFLLAEAIRRNHYGESTSPLFQHIED